MTAADPKGDLPVCPVGGHGTRADQQVDREPDHQVRVAATAMGNTVEDRYLIPVYALRAADARRPPARPRFWPCWR